MVKTTGDGSAPSGTSVMSWAPMPPVLSGRQHRLWCFSIMHVSGCRTSLLAVLSLDVRHLSLFPGASRDSATSDLLINPALLKLPEWVLFAAIITDRLDGLAGTHVINNGNKDVPASVSTSQW